MQIKLATVYAKRHAISLLEAVEKIALAFAAQYPNQKVN